MIDKAWLLCLYQVNVRITVRFIDQGDCMIYIFRLMVIFSILYLNYLFGSGFGAGMEPVWIAVLLFCLLMSFRRVYDSFFEHKWLKRFFIIAVVLMVVVEAMIIVTAFEDHSEDEYDYMIVLGAGLLGDRISLTLRYRLDVAYDYMVEHPEVIAVLSGGQGPGENMTEASAMEWYLLEKGITKDRLIKEEQSTSTRENIAYSFQIFEALGDTEPSVLIVSSRFHLLRAIRIAKEAGYMVDAVGSRTLQYLIPNYYFREMFAVVVEYVR